MQFNKIQKISKISYVACLIKAFLFVEYTNHLLNISYLTKS